MRGFQKLGRVSSAERRASIIKVVCATLTVIAVLFYVAPARVDFNQYVFGQSIVPGVTPNSKPVNLKKILMTSSGE